MCPVRLYHSSITQIRKANYATKGIYYQAFICLSTGLERIGKICLILDYYINSNGEFPDLSYVKKNIGHDIKLIYEQSIAIAEKRSIDFNFMKDLNGEIHQDILKILSDFAKGDRYSNINIIVGCEQKSDSIKRWYENIDKFLYEMHVTEKKKRRILQNAEIIDQITNGIALVRHISEDGSILGNVASASFQTGMYEAVAPYRQLYVLQVVRFWVELIRALQYEAMKLGKEDIPFFSEIFGLFYNSDQYFRSRKTWDNW
ncbi:hypothetical protein SAMN03080606_04134 [Alkaliphilus peptidifermentans DSM 18978]|uniref:Uncharacterized protein n=2 Tax=Alkaliphilus TaxID=114627 RepID=A0A1G5L8K2_9FIRM|nr:hypothetical protein SAMN03080606_04134 [Alkaliphilus peptidifermentans DSM 18978]